jgi:hypothetical protein
VRVGVGVIVKVFVGVSQGSSKLTELEATAMLAEANDAVFTRKRFAQHPEALVLQKYIPAVMVTA